MPQFQEKRFDAALRNKRNTLQGIKVFQKVIREKYNYESQVASPTSVSKGRGKKKSNRRVARKAEFVSANYTGVTLTTLQKELNGPPSCINIDIKLQEQKEKLICK